MVIVIDNQGNKRWYKDLWYRCGVVDCHKLHYDRERGIKYIGVDSSIDRDDEDYRNYSDIWNYEYQTLHREDGPAVILVDENEVPVWIETWIDGKKLSEGPAYGKSMQRI